jgi:hypothetical protein
MIWLIFAHFVGDIALQSDWQAQNKGRLWYVMFSHCMIWTACISISLQFTGHFSLWKVFFLVIFHGLMDEWKCRKPKTPESWKFIYPDQCFHILQCVFVYFS